MKTRKLFAAALGLVLGFSFFSCQKTNTSSRKPPVVTAGLSQTISLPTDTVVLSGYATDSSSTIVAYLWSQVSGPNAAFIQDDGSKTTVVTGFVPGTYIFQLEATDTFGLTGVDTTDEILMPQTNLSTLDLPNIDVTQLVKNMLANGNNGFEIRLQDEQIYNSRIFCSSSYSDTTKIPTLYITY
jgi:hypothetical protein